MYIPVHDDCLQLLISRLGVALGKVAAAADRQTVAKLFLWGCQSRSERHSLWCLLDVWDCAWSGTGLSSAQCVMALKGVISAERCQPLRERGPCHKSVRRNYPNSNVQERGLL